MWSTASTLSSFSSPVFSPASMDSDDIPHGVSSSSHHTHTPPQQPFNFNHVASQACGKSWSRAEDALLMQLVDRNRGSRTVWQDAANALIANGYPHRTGKQVRERFVNCLDPTVNREPISQQESALIFELHGQVGSRWCEIARRLNRPESMVKNHFHSTLRRLNGASQGHSHHPSSFRRHRQNSNGKLSSGSHTPTHSHGSHHSAHPSPLDGGQGGSVEGSPHGGLSELASLALQPMVQTQTQPDTHTYTQQETHTHQEIYVQQQQETYVQQQQQQYYASPPPPTALPPHNIMPTQQQADTHTYAHTHTETQQYMQDCNEFQLPDIHPDIHTHTHTLDGGVPDVRGLDDWQWGGEGGASPLPGDMAPPLTHMRLLSDFAPTGLLSREVSLALPPQGVGAGVGVGGGAPPAPSVHLELSPEEARLLISCLRAARQEASETIAHTPAQQVPDHVAGVAQALGALVDRVAVQVEKQQ